MRALALNAYERLCNNARVALHERSERKRNAGYRRTCMRARERQDARAYLVLQRADSWKKILLDHDNFIKPIFSVLGLRTVIV